MLEAIKFFCKVLREFWGDWEEDGIDPGDQ